ncbi:uncharacterized protein LOC131936794 [Physella acuta]|uniref:uncharacterized protein LOC131936794 n=1 Tax=Physella acuta TaxID=109671 RepID=UPI0027DC6985|nr:uncharacterized protein LOC131936794 [Physella acuta]
MALPLGWKKEEVVRQTGLSAGKIDVYYFTPDGKKIRSKQELARILGETFDLSAFDFCTRRAANSASRKRKCQKESSYDFARGVHHDANLGLPTVITNTPECKTEVELKNGIQDQSGQIFLEKRFHGLHACNNSEEVIPSLKLPYQIQRRKKVRAPKLTLVEELTKGLQTDPAVIRSNFTVKDEDGKGRGVYLKLPILRKDSFVLEYEGDVISEAEAQSREKIYAYNNEGCFIMSFVFRRKKLAVDATRRYDSITRLLNHSRQPNIKFHAPLLLDLSGNGLPRIAAYALRDIHRGEEIVFDYGVRDRHIPWLTSKQAGYVSDIDTSSDEETNEGCISMRISPHERSDYAYKENEASESKPTTFKENEASEFKPMTFKENEASTSSNSSSTKSEELSRKHLTFKQKSKAAFSNKSLGNFRVCCGWRFTRLIPGSNSFYAGLENIGPDMKIHKMYEDFSRRMNKIEEEIICLSDTDESTSSIQRETFEISSVSDVDQPNTVLSNLSSNINTNSDSKVLDWLPSVRESSSGLSQDMDIKIICVQSLIDPEPKNLNVKQPSTEQKQQPEPVLVIEDSSEDETLTALQNLTCHKSTNLTGSSPSSVSNPLPNISEQSHSSTDCCVSSKHRETSKSPSVYDIVDQPKTVGTFHITTSYNIWQRLSYPVTLHSTGYH